MTADLHTLTGAYAVDALEEPEQLLVEGHLEQCAACRSEVAELQATACRLGDVVAEPVPAGLKDRVLAEIDQVRQEPPSSGRRLHGGHLVEGFATSDAGGMDGNDGGGEGGHELAARRRARGRSWWDGLTAPAAAVVAVLVVGLVVLIAGPGDDGSEPVMASERALEVLAAPDADTLTVDGPDGSFARVVVAASRGEAVFLVDGLEPAPVEHTYELWLLDGDTATPAGLFDVDEHGRATRIVAGDLQAAEAIGVTVEPRGGSPEPTTAPILLVELDHV